MGNEEVFCKKYPYLVHYTRKQGVEGILRERFFYAKNYRLLNDFKEVIYSRSFLWEALARTVIKKGGDSVENLPDDLKEVFNALVNDFYNRVLPKYHMYTCSFCGVETDDTEKLHHGTLSQWRAYGEYAIVFRSKPLTEVSSLRDDWAMSAVSYTKDISEFIDHSSEQLGGFINDLLRAYEQMERDPENLDPLQVWRKPLMIIPFHKHWGFREEHEVRAVRYIQEEIEITKHKIFEEFSPLDCIQRVIVGPGHDQEERRLEMVEFLVGHNLSVIPVVKSEIPYRP